MEDQSGKTSSEKTKATTEFLANYLRLASTGQTGLIASEAEAKAARAKVNQAADDQAETDFGLYTAGVPRVQQQEIAGVSVPHDTRELADRVSQLAGSLEDAKKRLDAAEQVYNAQSQQYAGMPMAAQEAGNVPSSPTSAKGEHEFLRGTKARMQTAHNLKSFAALYLGDLAYYLEDRLTGTSGNHRVAKVAKNVLADLNDTRPWSVWADHNNQLWQNAQLEGFAFYKDTSMQYQCLFQDPVQGDWFYKNAVTDAGRLNWKNTSKGAREALQRVYSAKLTGANAASSQLLTAYLAGGNTGDISQIMNNVAVQSANEVRLVQNESVNTLAKAELSLCVKDLQWKQQHTNEGLTDDEGRALRAYREALDLQNPTDAETFLSQVKESLAYKDFTYKMTTLGLIDRVNTLYNIVYTLQDFWKQIMYTEMTSQKRDKWRSWTRRRLDMVQQYIEDRDNIMGKDNELLKAARKKLQNAADGLMLERTWAAIYIAAKYLDLALRNKDAPLFFEARPLSQDEAMTRLKAEGGWGKDSLRAQRPDDNVAVRLCQAEGLKVRYFDSLWKEGDMGTPVLDPHDPADRRRIDEYLRTQQGRLVVDCDGLIVSHNRHGKKETMRLPMPKNIPVSSLISVMPIMSYNSRSGRFEHNHESIREQLRNRIGAAEGRADKRVRAMLKYQRKNELPKGTRYPEFVLGST